MVTLEQSQCWDVFADKKPGILSSAFLISPPPSNKHKYKTIEKLGSLQCMLLMKSEDVFNLCKLHNYISTIFILSLLSPLSFWWSLFSDLLDFLFLFQVSTISRLQQLEMRTNATWHQSGKNPVIGSFDLLLILSSTIQWVELMISS